MSNSAYCVKSTPFKALTGTVQYRADMLDILKMCMKNDSANLLLDFVVGLFKYISDVTEYIEDLHEEV